MATDPDPDPKDSGEELPEDKHASPGTAPTVYPSPGVGHIAADDGTQDETRGVGSAATDVRTADDIGRDAPPPSTSSTSSRSSKKR